MKKFILLTRLTSCIFLKQSQWLWVFGILLLANPLQADTVQRWQDRNGQWHFGDYAAAKGQRSQAVVIKNPISVVKNEQPTEKLKAQRTTAAHQDTAIKRTKASARHSNLAESKAKAKCDALRNQLSRNPLTDNQSTPSRSSSAKKQAKQADLNNRYERECIAGHYYGG